MSKIKFSVVISPINDGYALVSRAFTINEEGAITDLDRLVKSNLAIKEAHELAVNFVAKHNVEKEEEDGN